jgi:phosphatidylserine/phosphatidylglycerophosphate/cardiolipin synthase-like enzyme
VQALLDLKKQKPQVSIEVQLADTCNYGSISEKDAYYFDQIFRSFDTAGIKVQMFNKKNKVHGRPGYMHAKVMIVDNKKAWVGSINVSEYSFEHNREFGIFLANKSRVAAFSQFLDEDFNDTHNMSWQKSVLECRRKSSTKEVDVEE